MIREILITRSRGGGDDGDALGQEWDGEGAVEVEDAIGLQLPNDLLASAHHVAHGEGGVDVVDGEGEAVEGVELDGDAHEHFQAGGEGAAGLFLEVGAEHAEAAGPDGAARPGGDLAGVFVFLDELQVAVAGIGVYAHFARLGAHPIRVGQGAREGLLDGEVQLGEREDAGGIDGGEGVGHRLSNG